MLSKVLFLNLYSAFVEHILLFIQHKMKVQICSILLLSVISNCVGNPVRNDETVSFDMFKEIKNEIAELRQQNEIMANEITILKNGQHMISAPLGKLYLLVIPINGRILKQGRFKLV